MAREAGNKFLERLQKLPGAVVNPRDPFAHIIRSPSPSLNFIFGNTHGLPEGFTTALYGPPKSGKSIICNALIGQLHKDDPEAFAVKWNTEARETGQTSFKGGQWGIDPNRYVAYNTNKPEDIFDCFEKDIAALCDDGAKVRLAIIDSMTGIMGRRMSNADTITTQQIGDDAKTQKDGLKRILMVQRKYGIHLILTAHVTAELDMAEQMRGNKVKMAAGWGLQHYAEYFVYVEPNRSKDGKADALGNVLEDDSVKDAMGKGEKTGHRIRVTMKDSSLGPKGRTGEFTLDYDRGIINQHEEVFMLGVNRGIVNRPNNMSYEFGGVKWVGKPAFLEALKNNEALQNEIIKELIRRDMDKTLPQEDVRSERVKENE